MGVMPYQFEKGAFPVALEGWFNAGLDTESPTATAAGLRTLNPPPPYLDRRLRAIWRYGYIANRLRAGYERDVTPENSFVMSNKFGSLGGPAFQRTIAEDWFGMQPVKGSNPPKWQRFDPTTWTPG